MEANLEDMGIYKFCLGCYDILMASATLAIAGGTQQGQPKSCGSLNRASREFYRIFVWISITHLI